MIVLDSHDDTRIRLVAKGLQTVVGREGAIEQLTRLYGRERTQHALRRTWLEDRYGAAPDDLSVIIDLREPTPRPRVSAGRAIWL